MGLVDARNETSGKSGGMKSKLQAFADFGEGIAPFTALAGDIFGLMARPSEQTRFTRFTEEDRAAMEGGARMTESAGRDYIKSLRSMGAQRMSALRSDLDLQLSEAGKVGQQIARDINKSYDAQLGATGQRMISSGLSNTTVASGMDSLVNRERSNALSRFAGSQAQYISSILGQRAAALAAERNFLDTQVAGIEAVPFQIRAAYAQRQGQGTQVSGSSGSMFEQIGESLGRIF